MDDWEQHWNVFNPLPFILPDYNTAIGNLWWFYDEHVF